MTIRFRQWTLDVHDVERMSHFWSQALGYRTDPAKDGTSVHLRPPNNQKDLLSVWLQPTNAAKTGKNRDHPDLIVEDENLDTEVQRLIGLGARHCDIGQRGDEGFIVLADPEGNEFCLLRHSPF
jgi:predicted enzyme related to lactoylglutathione lyase